MNERERQDQVRHATTALIAHRLWERGGKIHGRDVEDWLEAEKIAGCCPHCGRLTMDGLPWFANDAITVCPACCRVVMYRERIPLVPDEDTERQARQDRSVAAMLKAFAPGKPDDGMQRFAAQIMNAFLREC